MAAINVGIRAAWRRARPFLNVVAGDSSPLALGIALPAFIAAAVIGALYFLGVANDQSQAANQLGLLRLCNEDGFVSPRLHLSHCDFQA